MSCQIATLLPNGQRMCSVCLFVSRRRVPGRTKSTKSVPKHGAAARYVMKEMHAVAIIANTTNAQTGFHQVPYHITWQRERKANGSQSTDAASTADTQNWREDKSSDTSAAQHHCHRLVWVPLALRLILLGWQGESTKQSGPLGIYYGLVRIQFKLLIIHYDFCVCG